MRYMCMDKSIFGLVAISAFSLAAAGMTAPLDKPQANCSKFAWPNYPVECLIGKNVAEPPPLFRVAVSNVAIDADMPSLTSAHMKSLFGDTSYFGRASDFR
jgi:hypothetical protein